ncbi:unnamed protein product [Echinostoma caproni]|uniref:CUB domain-containing protein n=1 Tax=Echinostoma caproni TaxID=27848 RepID=A0A183A5R9_9TREM|nr:unnamed protein product [Echinostoma caproni]
MRYFRFKRTSVFQKRRQIRSALLNNEQSNSLDLKHEIEFPLSNPSNLTISAAREVFVFDKLLSRQNYIYTPESYVLGNLIFISEELTWNELKLFDKICLKRNHVDCLIYSFLALPDELVHIQFLEFNIPRATPNSKNCSAYVRVYNRIRTFTLNEDDPYEVELCGSYAEIPQDQYYSSFERLILAVKLHSDSEIGDYGFLGHYWFEPRDQYTITGLTIPGTQCDWFARSKSSTSGSSGEPGRSGRIQSPDYPQNYPPGLHCRFHFIGQPQERVILTLRDVELANTNEKYAFLRSFPAQLTYLPLMECCTQHLHGDYILLQEGKFVTQTPYTQNTTPQNRTAPLHPGRYIWHYCGKLMQAEIVSDGPNMLLTFVSNQDGQQRRGFSASYRFVHRNQVRPTSVHDSNQFLHIPGQEYQIMDSTFGTHSEWTESGSVKHYSWHDGLLTGTIMSPNYPDVYPQNIDQSYVIIGPPQGQIQLLFSAFHLDLQNPSKCTHYGGDRLELRVGPEFHERVWGVLCGVILPEQLRNLVIQHDRVRLRFVTDNVTGPTELGFRVVYDLKVGPRFATPHFSSAVGQQNHIRLNKEHINKLAVPPENYTPDNCTVLIDSHGVASRGYIRLLDSMIVQPIEDQMISDGTPRIERCRWILQGEAHQRIQLKVITLKDQRTATRSEYNKDNSFQNDEFQTLRENSKLSEYSDQNRYASFRVPRIK